MNLCQAVLAASDATGAKARIALERLGVAIEQVAASPELDAQELLAACERSGACMLILDESLVPRSESPFFTSLGGLSTQPDMVALVGDLTRDRQVALQSVCKLLFRVDWPVRVQRDSINTLLRRRAEQQARGRDSHSADDSPKLADFVSESERMQTFLRVVERIANTDSTLLLLGESGVGKERLARAIHAASSRASGPFVAMNCGALPESLLESELFGHEEGAFTGAMRSRKGYFEQAHKGTIFLDEIGDMPLHVQVKLLRVLQERSIQPLGSERQIGVDVRVMAATNCDLHEDVRKRKFREDLFYRLAVVTLEVPALRDRRQDIPVLLERHCKRLGHRFQKPVQGFAPSALACLLAYDWPGNVRELINVVERAVVLSGGPWLQLEDLPTTISHQSAALPHGGGVLEKLGCEAWCELPWRQVRHELLETAEREYLALLLKATGGRVGDAARRAGMTTRALFDKLRHHGMDKSEFRLRRPAAAAFEAT